MEQSQSKSFLARAQEFFLSSVGFASTNVGHEEVGAVLPPSCDRCEASSGPRKFHDEYSLKGKLGKGAFAQVHLAHKVSDGSAVAVKITDLRGAQKEDRGGVDPKIKRAVEREVAILSGVGAQECCVRFFEDYMEGLLSYVVMERCDMTLLQALERSSELTEKSLVRIIREMFQGVHSIHQLRVVHRDIKPDNFLITGENHTVKLCDFGLAEVLPSPVAELKGVYGTAPFMSPEMLTASGYGAATDVWSLGVIGYVLLFGRFPYQPLEATAKAMKNAIVAGAPAPSFKARASLDQGKQCPISTEAQEFLHAALDRNRASRPTAGAALSMAWLDATATSSQWSMPSLRPMLHAAKRAGAFDARGNNPHDKSSGVDQLLHALQTKSPAGSMRLSLCGGKGDRRTHSECCAEAAPNKAGHKIDKLDSALIQSGGVLSNASHISTTTGSCATSYQSNPSRFGGLR
eukprot:CAMPEP_0171172744 /NCGR_PEP_ID=MMETSP0790-20130122/9872_1 /TAXON_ID=2925 /ORGANISM="Alexandrium catenella, Strain OF101" /LENGTH=460 /DNA_ID=CAMNT_0011637601 /DNA_START=26 /DNA_END=1408 /DNA_ORIENTATION=-